MDILWKSNISLYTVPAAFMLCIAPHVYKIKLYEKTSGIPSTDSAGKQPRSSSASPSDNDRLFFDKTQPRTFLATVRANRSPKLTPEIRSRLARAEAASANGFENVGFYAASVAAASLGIVVAGRGGRDADTLASRILITNVLSLGYLAARVLYNVEYVQGVYGFRRGAWFWTSVLCAMTLFVSAGNAMQGLIE